MVVLLHKEEKTPIELFFAGDFHVGTKACEKEKLKQLVEKIRQQKNARLILTGDLGDYIGEDDTRRYDPNAIDPEIETPQKQTEYLKKLLKPIKSKIYGIVRGNHEHMYAKFHPDEYENSCPNAAAELAKELGTTYLQDLGIVSVDIERKGYSGFYDIIVSHGTGNSGKIQSQITNLQNISNMFEMSPDILVLGHVHTTQTIIDPKLDMDLNTKIKHLGLSGTFFQTYTDGDSNYASSAMFKPLPIGCISYSLDERGNIKDNKYFF